MANIVNKAFWYLEEFRQAQNPTHPKPTCTPALWSLPYGRKSQRRALWKYALAEWTGGRVKMDLPPRLDLGTINVVPFCEGLILPEHIFGVQV